MCILFWHGLFFDLIHTIPKCGKMLTHLAGSTWAQLCVDAFIFSLQLLFMLYLCEFDLLWIPKRTRVCKVLWFVFPWSKILFQLYQSHSYMIAILNGPFLCKIFSLHYFNTNLVTSLLL